MKKIIALLLVFTMVFTLVACGSNQTDAPKVETPTKSATTTPTEGAGEGKTIGIAIYSMAADSCVALVADAQEAADVLGWKIVLLDANGDPATQADQMATLVSQGVDAIILNPTDTTSLIPSIQAAIDADIPVSAVGMEMDQAAMDLLLFFAGMDDYNIGVSNFKWVAENFNGQNAQVALITGTAGTDPTNKTIKAMEDVLKGTDIESVGSYDGSYDTALAMSITEDLMVKYPDLDVIVCQDHVMAAGAASAISDAGKTGKIAVVATNGITDYLSYIEDGTVTAFSYVMLPYAGGFAIEELNEYFNGATPAAKYYLTPVLVTAENVAESYNADFDFAPAE